MKKVIAFPLAAGLICHALLAGGLSLSFATSDYVSAQQTEQTDTTVYVTKTGKKYHQAGCRHLSHSQIPMALKQAAAGYGPCGACKPPTLKAASDSESRGRNTSVLVGRCQATTKKGAQGLRAPESSEKPLSGLLTQMKNQKKLATAFDTWVYGT